MGNQSCGVTSAPFKDRIPGSTASTLPLTPAASPKKKAAAANAKPLSTDAATTSSLAADAVILRCFTERVGAHFPDLRAASDALGFSGGARLDAGQFDKALRAKLRYTDSVEIERIFKLLDSSELGFISEFELAKLFTAPELVRGLERQVKGKMATFFVAFNVFRPGGKGGITQSNFQDALQNQLGYKDVTLINTLFSMIDVDGKGGISEEEFKAFWNHGFPAPQGFYQPPTSRDSQQSTSRSRGRSPKSNRSPASSQRDAHVPQLGRASSTEPDGLSKQCKVPKSANTGRRRSCPSVHTGPTPAAAA